MRNCAPDSLGGEGLRTLERVGPPLAIDDEDGRLVPLDLRDIVRDDEVEVRLLQECEGFLHQLRWPHVSLRLEAHEGALRVLPECREDLRGRLEFAADRPPAA